MKKIKVMFKATNKKLEMKVLDIHESFDELRGKGAIVSVGNFSLQSACSPELMSDYVYLPGANHSNDYRLVSKTFKNNKERDAYIKKVNMAFIAWELKENNV